jgi:hypothetical protein
MEERQRQLVQLARVQEALDRHAERLTGERTTIAGRQAARIAAASWTEDGYGVAIELGQGDVAAIVLGLSEKSTAAQRALAREVVRGWVGQAFGQLADQLGFQR